MGKPTRQELFAKRLDLEDDEDFPFNADKQAEHARLMDEIRAIDDGIAAQTAAEASSQRDKS